MNNTTHIDSRTYLKNNRDLDHQDLRTSSLTTDYQSEVYKITRVDTIDDHSTNTLFTQETSLNNDPLNDFVLYYTKMLSHLLSKSEVLESGSKLNGLLNFIFSDFCNIQHQYIQRLHSLIERIDLSSGMHPNHSLTALSSFKLYIKRLTDNHKEFMDALSSECFLEDTNKAFSNINKEINKLKKELDSYKSDRKFYLSGMKENYFKAKNAVSICLNATHQAPSIKTTVYKTIIPVVLNFININNIVSESDDFNRFVDFNNRIDTIVGSLADLECKTSSEMADALSKFVVYETARLRNLQYDLNSLIDALNSEEPTKNHKDDYIYEQRGLMPKMGMLNYVELGKNEFGKSRNNHFQSASIQPPPFKVISKIENTMNRFIECLWGNSKMSSLVDFSEEIQSSLIRQIFCDMLSRNATSNPKLKTKNKFQLLIQMVNLILSVSERQSDYWSGYTVIKYSEKFYTLAKDSTEERCYLWSKICNNSYWRNRTFWEECLTIVISLDLKALFETNGCLTGAVKKIKCAPSTDDPLSFREWMLKYGIHSKECKEIIHRVCSRLKLPQSYSDSLI